MIGEIRDQETAEIAIQAALTGHLVFSTLHTNSAVEAVVRLLNMGIEPYLIACAVSGVLSQRLVRKICRHCKKEHIAYPELIETFKKRFGADNDYKIYKGAGCQHCRNTGFDGRLGVYEMFVPNDEIREMILKRESFSRLEEKARESGMISLNDDGLQKVINGLTTVDEILRIT